MQLRRELPDCWALDNTDVTSLEGFIQVSTVAEAATTTSLHPAAAGSLCSHCGQLVPAGLLDPTASEQFCCAGCRTVYAAIHEYGLERYYCLQSASTGETAPAQPTHRRYGELDAPEFLAKYALRVGPGLLAIEFFLDGVHCSACVWLVEKLPKVASGVVESRLDLGRALVRVVWEEDRIRLSQVARALDSLGYSPHVGHDVRSRELRQRDNRRLLVKIAVAGAGAGNVMLLAFALYGGSFHGMEPEYSALFRWASMAIGLVVLLGPASLFFRGAWAALRTRTAHLDLPIAIGLGAGALAGTVNTILGTGEIYFDSLTGLVFFLLVGRYIQRRLEQRAMDTVERLFSLVPNHARVHRQGVVHEVPIEALELNEIVEVRPGEPFPADGRVIEGASRIDSSLLTGEPRPSSIGVDSEVFAGTLNLELPVLAQTTALGRDTRVGKILALMQECTRRKAKLVELADRFAAYFTLTAILLFVATFVGWRLLGADHALDRAVTLLIVSCPCGLGLATPFAVSVALGRAARAKILIKGGAILERLAAVGVNKPTIFLDKTGTLTDAGLEVVEWLGERSVDPRLMLAVAALESRVNHPIALALARAATSDVDAPALAASDVHFIRSYRNGVEGEFQGRLLRVGSEQFVTTALGRDTDAARVVSPGWAVQGSRSFARLGYTSVWVSQGTAVVALVAVGGKIRDDAAATIADLQRRGLEVAILSGDTPDVVDAVGQSLGLGSEHCHGALSPEEKASLVEAALARGPVFMVGDGVNDAAALAAASVGIAVKGGAEASLIAADVYLGQPGLGALAQLLDGASRTISVIRRCLVVSLGYNVVAAALAISGHVNALVAAILMPVASFTVLAIAFVSTTFERTAQGRPSSLLGNSEQRPWK